MRGIEGGTYIVNDNMLKDLHSCQYGYHVCNLGGILASEIGGELGKPAYVVDPPVVNEVADVAKLSGHPDFPRRALFHALNQKAIAKRFAEETGRPYESLNLIVAHMGGGTSVGCHRQGKVVDVNNGLEGEGAFTGERCGGLTALDVVKATLSGQWGKTYPEIRQELCMRSGLVGHTGTNDGLTVIVSDFFSDDDWKKAVDYLCYKRRQVLLVQILTPDELAPVYDGRVNLIDSEAIDVSDDKNMKMRITRSMLQAYEEALYLAAKMQEEREQQIAEANARTEAANERYNAAKRN